MSRFFDNRQFKSAIRGFSRDAKKEARRSLDDEAAKATTDLRAATPKASPSKIRAELNSGALAIKLVSKPGQTRETTGQKARDLIRARVRSSGYIASRWQRRKTSRGVEIVNTAKGAREVAGRLFLFRMRRFRKEFPSAAGRRLQRVARRYSAR